MANKEKKKCPFNKERFNQVLKYRKTNIKELCSDLSQGYGYSVKTISRALKSGYASFEVVEWLSEKLDIDPEFIMGKYWYDPQKYGEKAEMLNSCIKPERFPYIKKLQRDKTDGKFLYDKYIENILVILQKKSITCKHRKYTYTFQILVGTPTKIVEVPASENAGTSFFRSHLIPPRNREPYNRM